MDVLAHSRTRCGFLLLVACGVLLAAPAVHAAFLRNVPQTLSQPDGTVVQLFATGDEFYNWLHDADGFVVVRDPANGYLVYATKVAGRLEPTRLVVGRSDPGPPASSAASGRIAGSFPTPTPSSRSRCTRGP